MAHRTLHLLVVCAALAVAGEARPAAQSRERIAYVTLVNRDTGEPRADVTVRDLVIREDGVAREVLRVTRATAPMPVALLVDTSAGADGAIPDIRQALTAFVTRIGDLGPVAVVGFGERPTLLSDYSTTPATIAAGIGRVFARPGSGATVIEAIDETAAGLGRRESERAAIVVVTANTIELSTAHYSRALTRLRDSAASLHVVNLSTPGRQRFDDVSRQRDTLLARGVSMSGGLRRDVLASMAFTPAMVEIARILTHQFRVVYARPESLIPPETIVVGTALPNVTAYGGVARGQAR